MVILPLALATASNARANLVFETVSQSVPAKWSDQQVVAVYKFKNTGNETVKITDLQSSCGCTVPSLDKKQYAPGESGELRAVFTVGDHLGPQIKTITLKTDLTAQSAILLTFKTDIPPFPDPQPQVVAWAKADKPDPKTITVLIPPDVPFDKIEIGSKGTAFTATLKTIAAGQHYEIVVTPPAAADNSIGVKTCTISVTVHLKDGTTRTSSASAMVR
jgi:hypothetical protein